MRLYVFTATKRPIDEMGRIALPQELRDLLKIEAGRPTDCKNQQCRRDCANIRFAALRILLWHRELKTDRQALYLRKLYGTHALHEKSVLIANAFYPLF